MHSVKSYWAEQFLSGRAGSIFCWVLHFPPASYRDKSYYSLALLSVSVSSKFLHSSIASLAKSLSWFSSRFPGDQNTFLVHRITSM